MPDDLYDRDILAWSERQVAVPRRVAAGERLNDEADWLNIPEEIEPVGRSALRACEALLLNALTHTLELHVWPDAPSIAHWRREVAGFLIGAARRFSPSMRQHIDIAGLYGDALDTMRAGLPEPAPRPWPAPCPFTRDDPRSGRPMSPRWSSGCAPDQMA